ncbi:hypothetical protein GCM10023347_49880 [Streptomyces chumphonensis]|uniref:C2H2-type domain-containing protein n=1 Tax=Streptomyces chumphonensis TaxID=1214925 RepID=A0A927F0H4_9ACTN|nr:hypothetical protein [Streptomyces chumphonensis]MBD3933354.1 hypothetical protein [Streptomyces chumphonensis]
MSDFRDTPLRSVEEAYAFACLACGHSWEQNYRIEHHLDEDNRPYFLYFADSRRVPSPLNRLTCPQCDGHDVRIVRAGQADSVSSAMDVGWPPLRR